MIDLGKNIKVKMKYPSYTTMKMILDNDTVINKQINIIAGSIDQVIDGDTVHTTKDLTKEEIIEFIENLTKEQYSKLEYFINNFPSFEIKSKATCDKCGFEHNLSYSDFTSFFV
jgi:preprotein translocase subunit SecA